MLYHSSAFLRKYTYTDSKRVVSHDFKASTLLICIAVSKCTSKIDSPNSDQPSLCHSSPQSRFETYDINLKSNVQLVFFMISWIYLTIKFIIEPILKYIRKSNGSRITTHFTRVNRQCRSPCFFPRGLERARWETGDKGHFLYCSLGRVQKEDLSYPKIQFELLINSLSRVPPKSSSRLFSESCFYCAKENMPYEEGDSSSSESTTPEEVLLSE